MHAAVPAARNGLRHRCGNRAGCGLTRWCSALAGSLNRAGSTDLCRDLRGADFCAPVWLSESSKRQKRPNTHARAENPPQARTGPENGLIRSRGRRRPHGTACTADSDCGCGCGQGQDCDGRAVRPALRRWRRNFGFTQVTAVLRLRAVVPGCGCAAVTGRATPRAVAAAVSWGNWSETRYKALWPVEPAKPTKYPHAARQAVSGPYRAGKRADSWTRSVAVAAGQSNTQPSNRTLVPRPAENPDFVTWITAPRACGRATCARARVGAYQAKKAACPVNRCDFSTRAKRAARRSEARARVGRLNFLR